MTTMRMVTLLLLAVQTIVSSAATTQPSSDLKLEFRRLATIEPTTWDPRKTAVVICDMWNDHWCKAAAGRVAEMAPRMNDTISALRDRGVLIIHCPSDTMKYYADHPGRKLAQAAPKVETKIPLQ